jgi:hypothetical protein
MTTNGFGSWPSWRRLGGWAGIVFGFGMVAFLILLFGSAPLFDDPIGEIRDYFDNDAGFFFTLNWFGALVIVAVFLLFASALRSVLATRDVDAGVWSRFGFAGAVAAVAVSGAGALFQMALGLSGTEQFSDGAVRLFMNADAIAYQAIAPWGYAVFLLGASVVILRTGVFARWLAWAGFGIAAVMVVGLFWVIDGDPEGPLALLTLIGFAAFLLWSIAVGASMVRSRGSTPT